MGDDPRAIDTTLPSLSAPQKDVAQVWLSHAPGERIAGKYQLIRTLDQGGMGVVWVAHHLGLDIHVALKLVRPEVESPEAVERLVLEAQAAARLRHPAIVQILDVGRTDEGDPFLVMELLDGECLADILDREGRIDVVTALRVILPIAGALQAMHAKGILHRDVKPDNIFLSRDDAGRWQPKLIDFGLARIDDRRRAGRITQRGAVVGTPVYLSPERIRGEEADARDDVWALCVVLYLSVTGELPFDGDNVLDLFAALAQGEPRSLASHGVTDPALWDILRRGLSRRAARWPSMLALEEALTFELLERGATKDIAGLELRPTARASAPPPTTARAGGHAACADGPPPPPEQLRPGWQVLTGRLSRPPSIDLARARSSRPPSIELPTIHARGRPSPPCAGGPRRWPGGHVDRLPRSSVPPLPDPRAGARLTPLIALGLVMLGLVLGLIAGVLIGRRSAAPTAVPPATATAGGGRGVTDPPGRAVRLTPAARAPTVTAWVTTGPAPA